MNTELFERIVGFINDFTGTDRECISALCRIYPKLGKGTIGSIHTLIEQRKTIKNFHRVKNNAKIIYDRCIRYLHSEQPAGVIMKLAKQNGIQPIAMARILLEHHISVTNNLGNKKSLYGYLQDTTLIDDKYFSEEILMCNITDCVNGPITDLIKNFIGKENELKLEKYLSEAGVQFKTEQQLRQRGYDKTPDILLDIPVAVGDFIVHWIESKALFADVRCHKQYISDQYMSYFNRFGTGLVIYWYGYLGTIADLEEYKSKFIVRDHFPELIFFNPDAIK